MFVPQFLHVPLGYWCRFWWYNFGRGTDSGELYLLLISLLQGFFFSSFSISISQALVLRKLKRKQKERVFIGGETEIRVSLNFWLGIRWWQKIWVAPFCLSISLSFLSISLASLHVAIFVFCFFFFFKQLVSFYSNRAPSSVLT